MEQIFESKLNHLTLEELSMIDPDPYKVIINKLLHEGLNNNSDIKLRVNNLAKEICLIETKRRLNHKKNSRGVNFHKSRNMWVAQRKIGGKAIHIKSGKDKSKVQDAYNKFCIENNLEP